MAKYTVAVAGATGYAGGEALRILAAHPDFDITCVAGHSSVGESMAKHMPHIPQLANLVVEDTTPEVLNGHDVIILALPHGASGKLASQLDPNAVVVDLGADHRLEEQAAWDEFYGGDFYEHWTYGMPELITGKAADGSYLVNDLSHRLPLILQSARNVFIISSVFMQKNTTGTGRPNINAVISPRGIDMHQRQPTSAVIQNFVSPAPLRAPIRSPRLTEQNMVTKANMVIIMLARSLVSGGTL